MGVSVKVELVPWDPASEEHVKRMLSQRIQCGWNADKMPEWTAAQTAGTKCMWWIVLSDTEPKKEELRAAHTEAYPESIRDTAATIRGVACRPTGADIFPVGHIALDTTSPAAHHKNVADLGLPGTGVYWIKSLYVSRAMRGNGVGRAAMDLVESRAQEPPLNATTLALDTLQADDQQISFVAMGVPLTTVNQEWYARRGYRLIKAVQGVYEDEAADPKAALMHAVFMRKDL